MATTTQGAVAWQGTYAIFGSATAPAGLLTQNLRLPGQFADTTTGYSQNGFRDYYPALGRYLESDPIGLNWGVNSYAYVRNNPVNLQDPHGTCIEDLCIGETALVVEAVEAIEAAGAAETVAADTAVATEAGDTAAAQTGSQIDRGVAASERQSFWKNEARQSPDEYSPEDLQRMQQGKPPIGEDGSPEELHHNNGTHEGGLTRLTRTLHRLGKNFRKNHPWLCP